MNLYVVSDLHIRGADDPIYSSLLALLRQRAQPGDTVVLAGDVFDLFIMGKQFFIDRYAEFFRELRLAGERGVRLHYIEGNHDFLLHRAFQGYPGLTHHRDEFSIDLGGKRFFFSHGDTVDRTDYGYRFLRAFLRSIPLRLLGAVLPGRWVDWIGRVGSRTSRGTASEVAVRLPLERMEALRKIYRNFAAERLVEGHDFVVMGHCHDLDEMGFQIGDRAGQYVNVGYPRVHGSFLSWSPGDAKIQREKLPDA